MTSPGPTAAITSPAPGATVSGDVSVTANGQVDATQTDRPSQMDLYVDGSAYDVRGCTGAPDPSTCPVTFSWNSTGLSGQHTLQVKLTTNDGLTALSAVVQIYVYAATRTVLTPLGVSPSGTTRSYRGRVTAANGRAAPGVPVKITLTPSVGAARTVVVTSNSAGYFATAHRTLTNTRYSAGVAATVHYGASSANSTARVTAPFTCVLAAATVRRGVLDRGNCKVAYLPAGTPLTLQYQSAGHWYNLSTGKSPSTTIPFSFRLTRAGTYYVRILLAASRPYIASTGPALRVTVT